jgi:hypothetical protein
MTAYDNTNQGVLFKNDDKQKDTHPDYRGSVNVNGTEFWLSAWIKTSQRDGSKFMSLSVRKKDGQEDKPKQQQSRSGGQRHSDDSDDIPFTCIDSRLPI